ncbi:MAG: xanthine dehydrogenase family protein molybdopterin-binding subunit, partial [Proteobacteria bacterium]|nr:xanthine dehydrogenase family protein molybdopterin-binding subunit [Pseudomonadota bacterium]
DGVDKVTGRASFGADHVMPGMLWGRVLRSPHAHALIKSINVEKALALPGVKAVVTGEDLGKIESREVDGGEAVVNIAHLSKNILAQGKVLYDGHAIASVAATTDKIARDALKLIEVEYELLPFVIDVDEAMGPDSPLLHDDLFTKGMDPKPDTPSNIASVLNIGFGDVEAGFAAADIIIEREFKTKPVHQGYIEPHACIANIGEDGQAVVWCSSQGQFTIRDLCAGLLGMESSDVRVIPAEIGGGFGGKTTVYLEPLALMLAKISGRPVKMTMTRGEVFRATGPTSGSSMTVKIGATKDGRITAADAEFRFQAGAFPGSPVGACCMAALTPYDLENVKIRGYDVVCNIPKVGAYRAPGAPNGAFAVESVIDMMAKAVNMDPVDFRVKNGAKEGTKAPYGPTFKQIGNMECLTETKKHPQYTVNLGPNQGRGVASGFWFNVGGQSAATVVVNSDGTVSVIEGNPDIGGSRASMAMMAAEVFGIEMEKVRAIVADTSSVAHNDTTGGSRVTFATGMAVTQASEEAVQQLRERAAKLLEVIVDDVVWDSGVAHVPGTDKSMTIAQIAAKAGKTGGPITGHASINARGAGPSFTTHICDLEVDRETGQVTILRYTAIQDAGKAVHPSYVEGQMQGGVVQGIGWALNEEYIHDAEGHLENDGFLDYRMPVASDLPMIDTVIVEVPNPTHPFGVRGVGEAPIVPPLAAIANAIEDAVGVRITELPISPPKLLAAMDAAALKDAAE